MKSQILTNLHTTGHGSILALGRATLAVSERHGNVQARNRSKTGGNCLGLHPTTPPAFHSCPVV